MPGQVPAPFANPKVAGQARESGLSAQQGAQGVAAQGSQIFFTAAGAELWEWAPLVGWDLLRVCRLLRVPSAFLGPRQQQLASQAHQSGRRQDQS